ncbi:hypothetical protein Tco_0935907, partial [Tanacetum coccineum]
THNSQASGSGDGVDILLKVPDEQVHEKTGTDEGAGDKPEVLDVPEHHSNSEEESWTFSDGDDDDEDDDANKDLGDDDDEDDDANKDLDAHDDDDDDDATESDDDGDNIIHPKLSTFSTDDQEEQDDEENKKMIKKMRKRYLISWVKNGKEDNEGDVSNVALEGGDVDMTKADTTKDTEDAHVTLMAATPVRLQLPLQQSLHFFPVTQSSQQIPITTTTPTNPSTTLLPLHNFASVFGFNQRVTALESDLSKLKQSNPFAKAISSIPGIINEYLGSKMKEAELELKRILMDKMEEEYKSFGTDQITRDDKDKDEEPSAVSNRGTNRKKSGKEVESSKETTRDNDVIPARETVSDLPPQHWITDLAQAAGKQSSFDEFMATPIDFSAFMINIHKIDHLTQELLTDPTYNLIKGTCKSVAELDYHLEEVFKATNEQLDWNNPEGTPYPHNLSKPLPLIPNSNELKTGSLELLRVWVPIDYDKHAYWGTYHWGPKRQRLYGYATNMETSKDVYSRHKIIAVISFKIMKFFGYSHLEEITVHRQDDVLYKFREGDFKRLRRQDIKDMLLLLVQGKITNLSLDDRYALNVALRMYTQRIAIQERVEDL